MDSVYSYVSREAYERILIFKNLLLKWNKVINLISANSIQDIMHRHILDSIQLLNYLDKSEEIIDLGSGGGLPAIILSIAGVKNITLIESDSRKAAFLLQAAKISDYPVRIINDRIENCSGLSCDILTSRAFAELNSIFDYSRNIEVRNKFLLHKGTTYKKEITLAEKHWLFNIKVHDSITSDAGHILEIINLKYK